MQKLKIHIEKTSGHSLCNRNKGMANGYNFDGIINCKKCLQIADKNKG